LVLLMLLADLFGLLGGPPTGARIGPINSSNIISLTAGARRQAEA
jgi:hypothetical protein